MFLNFFMMLCMVIGCAEQVFAEQRPVSNNSSFPSAQARLDHRKFKLNLLTEQCENSQIDCRTRDSILKKLVKINDEHLDDRPVNFNNQNITTSYRAINDAISTLQNKLQPSF
jgi:hypothetical protein